MNASNISRVKRIMRQVEIVEVKQILDRLLSLPTAEEVVTALEQEMRARYPEIFTDAHI
jgi:phosphoenolpyruvate-protein kinase (PTS system EI component)